jgi:hypothetical protein
MSNWLMKVSLVCCACFLASLAAAIAQQPTPAATETPTASGPAAVNPTSTPAKPLTETAEPKVTPAPSASPGGSQLSVKDRKFESMAQKFHPNKVQPMPSSSASKPSGSPAGTTGKQEKEKLKHESAIPSPSTTP